MPPDLFFGSLSEAASNGGANIRGFNFLHSPTIASAAAATAAAADIEQMVCVVLPKSFPSCSSGRPLIVCQCVRIAMLYCASLLEC